MAYRPRNHHFTDPSADDAPVTYIRGRLNEPTSPATSAPGETYALEDTPRTTEDVLYVAQTVGPAGVAKAQVNLAGAGWVDGSTGGVAVGGTVDAAQPLDARGVGLPFAGDDCPEVSFTVWVGTVGEGDWLGDVG